ncbi:C-type natriuretic peptide 2-like [Colossoma macropomum]|uniref:C-type natriuretic peptide 2-like n=1 Tax=Colossoma macropomum TaxID=42526 RepID=UPI001863D5E4|nr:C-type natriuretic peptide 2-like [Colossoma macropomum]
MEVPYALICGLLMVTLSLKPSAKPLTAVQDKLPAANRTLNLTVTEITPRVNVSRSEQNPDVAARVKNPPSARRTQTNRQTNKQTNRQPNKQPNKREKGKNCFGLKMDRISDLSGMGCKKD